MPLFVVESKLYTLERVKAPLPAQR